VLFAPGRVDVEVLVGMELWWWVLGSCCSCYLWSFELEIYGECVRMLQGRLCRRE